jgi:hypothetical protein
VTKRIVKHSWLPTRKWYVNAAAALLGWFIAFENVNEHFTPTIKIALATVVVQLISTWAVPNLKTPGGTPLKRVV